MIIVLLVLFFYDIITKIKIILKGEIVEEIVLEDSLSKKKRGKSVRKIKREHRQTIKVEKKKIKKLAKGQRHIAKKIGEKIERKQPLSTESLNQTINEFEKQSINAQNGKTKQQKVLIVRKSKEKPMSKKRKVLNFISYVLVGIIAIGFGYIGGNFYYSNYMDQPTYDFDVSELRDNGEEVYNRIVGQNVASQKAIDIIVASEYVLSQTQKYEGNVVGSIQPSIGSEQTVRGTKGRNGNVFYVENYSKGMLAIAEKYEYNTEQDLAIVYHAEGGDVKVDSANFPSSPSATYTKQQYADEYGTAPDSVMVPYIISSKTYIEGTESVKSLGDGKYQVTMSLSNDKAVTEYVKQMKHMSGLANYPKFSKIVVSFVVDSSYRILSLRYDESYSVTYFGVPAKCVGWLEVEISY